MLECRNSTFRSWTMLFSPSLASGAEFICTQATSFAYKTNGLCVVRKETNLKQKGEKKMDKEEIMLMVKNFGVENSLLMQQLLDGKVCPLGRFGFRDYEIIVSMLQLEDVGRRLLDFQYEWDADGGISTGHDIYRVTSDDFDRYHADMLRALKNKYGEQYHSIAEIVTVTDAAQNHHTTDIWYMVQTLKEELVQKLGCTIEEDTDSVCSFLVAPTHIAGLPVPETIRCTYTHTGYQKLCLCLPQLKNAYRRAERMTIGSYIIKAFEPQVEIKFRGEWGEEDAEVTVQKSNSYDEDDAEVTLKCNTRDEEVCQLNAKGLRAFVLADFKRSTGNDNYYKSVAYSLGSLLDQNGYHSEISEQRGVIAVSSNAKPRRRPEYYGICLEGMLSLIDLLMDIKDVTINFKSFL